MPPTSRITIRSATPADVPQILQYIRDLATYERDPDAVVATEPMLHQSLFGRDLGNGQTGPACEALMGLIDNHIRGFAVFFHNYSTWLGRAGMYLEDLYVDPALRGHGLGKALLLRVASIAHTRGCHRLEWNVLDWNTPALDFYRSLGAEPLSEWTIHRVAGPTLAKLAAMDS